MKSFITFLVSVTLAIIAVSTVSAQEIKISGSQILGLNNDHEIEYFVSFPFEEDTTKCLIIRPRVDWDYDSFRIFYTYGEETYEGKVFSVVRYKDGGTTNIQATTEWYDKLLTFHFPINPSKNCVSVTSYGGAEIIELKMIVR